MRLWFIALTLIAGSAAAAEAPIEPDAWRALTEGKTLHYYRDGELYGREYYDPDGERVVFRFPNGACAEGRWAFAEEKYCFAYANQLHCFRHVLRGRDIYVIGVDDGDEQKVEKIIEGEPLSCAEAINS